MGNFLGIAYRLDSFFDFSYLGHDFLVTFAACFAQGPVTSFLPASARPFGNFGPFGSFVTSGLCAVGNPSTGITLRRIAGVAGF